MQLVVLYGLAGELRVSLPQKLVVDSNTIVGECLAVTVIDAFANLQKF